MSKHWLRFPPIHLVASSFVKSPDGSDKKSKSSNNHSLVKDPEERFNKSMMMGLTNPEIAGRSQVKGSREYNQHIEFLKKLKSVGDLDTLAETNIDQLFDQVMGSKK